jgi:hypothetical protein
MVEKSGHNLRPVYQAIGSRKSIYLLTNVKNIWGNTDLLRQQQNANPNSVTIA